MTARWLMGFTLLLAGMFCWIVVVIVAAIENTPAPLLGIPVGWAALLAGLKFCARGES